jgi:glycerophosphoryl diester phosphodiesterase
MREPRPLANGRFDLQGHRGARGLWPENTLAGFARTRALGVTTFELDCAVTRDAVVVVSHDPQPNPDHTRDAQGHFLKGPGPPICALSYAQLQQYDVGRLKPGTAYAAQFPQQQPVDGERIPRLADLFALFAAPHDRVIRFNIEAKLFPLQPALTVAPEAFVSLLLDDVRRAGLDTRVTIQCFDWRVLRLVQKLAPKITTAALTDQQGEDDTVYAGRSDPSPWLAGLNIKDFGGSVPRLAKASGAAVWSPHHLDLTAPAVAEAHKLGLLVTPWTVNAPADMRRHLAFGVDGMISDRPDLLRNVLQEQGIAVPAPPPPPVAD